ncbi:hypothetical protein EIP91_011508 [Steccherinum ochraceum]|uniref:DUF6533 domain-containing protein n=1 Tax=Steccherinum ochraceum TaxID=92696 RepID=A0A4R0RLU3_9APHY|nr:hypothetical protein EIP91_011508 [Steccherinum ochraceum]
MSQVNDLVNALLATKYLAAAGMVCALYDHALTFSQEVNLIWARPRWGVTPALCKGFIITVGVIAVLSMTLGNIYAVLRIYSLWDERKGAMYALVAGFFVCYGTLFVMFGLALKTLFKSVAYSAVVNTCVFSQKPVTYVGLWASMVAFDVYALCLVIFNALDRPHRRNHGIQLLDDLNRDGAMFNLILFCIRLINLCLSIKLGAADMFLGIFFIWALISITMSRLMLRVEALRAGTFVHPWAQNMSGMQLYDMPMDPASPAVPHFKIPQSKDRDSYH